jgi:L-aminopeptidase/D-esterase-like protein
MGAGWSIERARERSITDVGGVLVGQRTDLARATGCTVVLCERPMVGGVDVRGGGTATREIELLRGGSLVERVDAVVLSGGSAMGLGCAQGVVDSMREAGRGFPTAQGVVPIVPGAAIFDRSIGDPDAYPVAEDGRRACEGAGTRFERGCAGAGSGAMVGKFRGAAHATKGGIGSAGWSTADGLRVGAIACVNALGDVVDPERGRIIAGARDDDGGAWGSAARMVEAPRDALSFGTNTTLVVVATNARFDSARACAVARMASAGLARSVSPCYTQYDGDICFALCGDEVEADLNRVGVLASLVAASAIVDAVLRADSWGGGRGAGEGGGAGRAGAGS